MDIESFISVEKYKLTQEYERLQYFKKYRNSIEALNNKSDNNNKSGFQCDHHQEDCHEKENYINENNQNEDDMEQWVANSCYSYFPAYNDECQKREKTRNQDRNGRENIKEYHLQREKEDDVFKRKSNIPSTSSIPNLIKSNRLIFTTPNIGQESARYKLLRDLRHTDLCTILNSNENDIEKLKRQEAELALAKQKEYQLVLLQQIEEKRQQLKALKEKEEIQERESTKRLEKQLKMMQLEELKEKEKLRNSRHLKLDRKVNTLNETNKNNKVYKYFSNYSKKSLSDSNRSYSESLSEMDLYEKMPSRTEKECFHLSEKICPMCNGLLKEFQNFCLHCQKKLLLGLKQSPATVGKTKTNAGATSTPTTLPISNNNNDNVNENIDDNKATEVMALAEEVNVTKDNEYIDEKDIKNYENGNVQNCKDYSLVCCNCYRFYTYCSNCSSRNGDLCRACKRKRNVCVQCRRDLCSFCLEEIACGKDVEQIHINEREKSPQTQETNNELSSKGVCLGLSESTLNASNNFDVRQDNAKPYNISNLECQGQQKNQRSINRSDDSFKSVKALNDINEEEINMERMHRDIEKRLVLYFKHYGDLIQTKRNKHLNVECKERKHSLSKAMLRDMPKLKRNDICVLQKNG